MCTYFDGLDDLEKWGRKIAPDTGALEGFEAYYMHFHSFQGRGSHRVQLPPVASHPGVLRADGF